MALATNEKKRYYRKNVDFCNLVEKVKLWPSRGGTLHGVKSITRRGNTAEIETHCNRHFIIYNSKNSRAARWMRNKLYFGVCQTCKVPDWKLQKYSSTVMSQHYGAQL
jgi:pyrrolysyl-tRNA synthetase, N-terminal region